MSFRELFCIKAGFPTVKSAESQDFPRIILENGFSIPQKVKFLLFKDISLLLKLILDKYSTMGDQYCLDLEEKM
jgi:hypothetical protein